MSKLFSVVCIIAIVLCAVSASAEEKIGPSTFEVERYQVVTNDNNVFLVDTVVGNAWILNTKVVGNTKQVSWMTIGFEPGGILPGSTSIFVIKK